MNHPNYKKAEQEALKLLKELGYESPPVKTTDVAAHLGLSVYAVDMPAKFEKVAGYVNLEENEIIVNKADPIKRKTFTIAHEIGHYVLHKSIFEKDPSKQKVLFRHQITKSNDPIEKEANAFAANLLVPMYLLNQYKDYSRGILSTLFGVSQEVIKFRQSRNL